MSDTSAPAPRRGSGLAFPAAAVAVALVLMALAWFLGPGFFRTADYWKTYVFGRVWVFLFSLIILATILHARRGGPTFIRRIPGLTAIDETVGRATEMGRPITFALGLGSLNIVTLQALAIALHVIRLSIRFGTRVILTMANPTVYAVSDEAVREAYTAAGRPESYRPEDVRFLSDRQFTYAAAMVGLIYREKVASNYMFGAYTAEALILAEAGNQVGAIQVAGTPSTTQVPFFIAACDYTIIGDEYYAASAYLTREPVLSGSLVGQDRAKITLLVVILLSIVVVTVLTLLAQGALPQAAEWVKTLTGLFRNAQ